MSDYHPTITDTDSQVYKFYEGQEEWLKRLFPTEDSARDAVFAGAWLEHTTETKDESVVFRARLRYPDEEGGLDERNQTALGRW